MKSITTGFWRIASNSEEMIGYHRQSLSDEGAEELASPDLVSA